LTQTLKIYELTFLAYEFPATANLFSLRCCD